MVRYRVNRFQWYIKTPKEITIEAKELKILKAIKLIVQGVKAKPKILAKEDI